MWKVAVEVLNFGGYFGVLSVFRVFFGTYNGRGEGGGRGSLCIIDGSVIMRLFHTFLHHSLSLYLSIALIQCGGQWKVEIL